MKNIKIKLFLVLLTAFALTLNLSCKNLLHIDEDDEDTYITIQLEENSERMVMPSVTVDSLTDIALYKSSVAIENRLAFWSDYDSMKNVKISMDEGECTLILKATLGEIEVQDSKKVTISAGANRISFSVTASNEAIAQTIADGDKGSVKINLSYEGNGTVSNGLMQLTSDAGVYNGSLTSYSDGKLVFDAKDIPAGYYTFAVQAKVGENFAAYKGTVYIVKNLTSVGNFTCVLTYGALIKSVKIKIVDTYNGTTIEKTLCAGANFADKTLYRNQIYPDGVPERPGYIFGGFENGEGKDVGAVPSEDCTLKVRWLEAKTITFVTNSDSEVAPVKVPLSIWMAIIEPSWNKNTFYPTYGYSSDEHIAKPEKAGYIFKGWYFDEAFENKASCSDWSNYYQVKEDFTLYAKWERGCIVSFVDGDGNTFSSITVEKGTNLEIVYCTDALTNNEKLSLISGYYSLMDLSAPSKENYIFDGWYKDSEYQTSVMGWENSFTVYDDMKIYAKYGESCILTFLNGTETDGTVKVAKGTSISINKNINGETYIYNTNLNSTIETFTTPEITGKILNGWYIDEDCTTSASNSFTVSGDMKIYAKFDEACTLTFLNGTETIHTVEVAENSSYRIGKYDSGETYIKNTTLNSTIETFTTPEITGKIFIGWYMDDTFTTSASYFNVYGNVSIYARYDDTYTISFNTDGGGNVDAVNVPRGSSVKINNYDYGQYLKYYLSEDTNLINGSELSITKPSKTNYVFSGFYKDKDCTEATDSLFTVDSDITLYAKWLNTITITLDANGGAFLERYGVNYMTDAFYIAEHGTTTYSFNVPSGSTITEVESWSYNAYTDDSQFDNDKAETEIRYKLSNSTSDTSLYKETYPYRTGYIFGGWFKDKECTESLHNSSDDELNLTVTGNTTFYAKWLDAFELKIMNGDTLYKTVYLPKDDGIYGLYFADDFEGYEGYFWGIEADKDHDYEDYWLFAPENAAQIPDGYLYEDAACTQKLSVAPDTFTLEGDEKTVYIKWVDPCVLTFDFDGTTFDFVVPDGSICKYEIQDSYIEICNSELAITYDSYWHYRNNWDISYTESGDQILYAMYKDTALKEVVNPYSFEITEDTTFYAGFADKCSVTINTGSTSSVLENLSMAKGSSFFLYDRNYSWDNGLIYYNTKVNWGDNFTIGTPVNSGYTFAGWYLDSEFSTPVPTGVFTNSYYYETPTCENPYTVNGDITLYAKWE